jgi:hypothetical protein
VSAARATVFGLDVWGVEPLSLLAGAAAAPTGRRLELSSRRGVGRAPAERDGFELLWEQLEPDGTVNMRVEAHPDAGYLLWGPRYGSHFLSADGGRVSCVADGAREQDWQRMLIAQVLPFAAVLNGLEVFHASAVVLDGQAVAFAGPSRAGKTSLALALCRLGAGFLADDVLALERDGAGLVGHPGSALAGVAREEARRLASLGEVLGANARELLVRTPTVATPAPLAALFFLERCTDGPDEPRFEPLTDAGMLLSATFNFLLAAPERLQGLLDVCARAARVRVERAIVGPTVDASALSAVIARRLRGSR